MRLAHMDTFHTPFGMRRRVIAATQGCTGWINKTTLRLLEPPGSSKMSLSDDSKESFTPNEAAALLAALIRIAQINGEISEDRERRLADQCRQELLKIRDETDLWNSQTILDTLSELIMRLTLRTQDNVLQTLSPKRMAGLKAALFEADSSSRLRSGRAQ
ncbi:hypothetical protein [Pseudarthrobacter sp. NPDC080039]|uniref:hypothetical protein n=1 Tax=unclassified Pseudarthrobacter TaxID=2647000 RepID=UPI00344DD9D3